MDTHDGLLSLQIVREEPAVIRQDDEVGTALEQGLAKTIRYFSPLAPVPAKAANHKVSLVQ